MNTASHLPHQPPNSSNHFQHTHPTASLEIEYPMLFKVSNRATGRHTHCGVLEFIAQEGHVYLPRWVSVFTVG